MPHSNQTTTTTSQYHPIPMPKKFQTHPQILHQISLSSGNHGLPVTNPISRPWHLPLHLLAAACWSPPQATRPRPAPSAAAGSCAAGAGRRASGRRSWVSLGDDQNGRLPGTRNLKIRGYKDGLIWIYTNYPVILRECNLTGVLSLMKSPTILNLPTILLFTFIFHG